MGTETQAGDALDRECAAIVQHLLGRGPSEYVRSKYRHAHERIEGRLASGGGAALLDLARRGPFAAGLVDAYTRVLRPTGVFRRKVALLLAILETEPESAARFILAEPASMAAFLVRMVPRTLAFAGRFGLAVLVVGPVDLVGSTRRKEAPWSA